VVALALALQAAGIAWLAVVSAPTVAYGRLVPPFILAGLGMGLFFAPAARMTLGFAPRSLEGVASGTSNALRQLGAVLGIAVLVAALLALGIPALRTQPEAASEALNSDGTPETVPVSALG
jgi:hypothetical protein